MLAQEVEDIEGGSGDVEAEHVGPRNHDLAHQRVLELEHLVDHLALRAVHHALARAHVDQGSQLLLRDLRLAPLPLRAHEAQGHGGQRAQDAAHRPEEGGQPRYGSAHPRRVALGMLYGQGHGQHLAEDEEEHGHGPDGDGETERAEEGGGDGGGDGGGADIGEGDADEDGDEELVRLREQRLQRALIGILPLGQTLEAGPPQREVGRLRPREERGDEDEGEEAQELEDGEAIHGSARSRAPPSPASRPRRGRSRPLRRFRSRPPR